MIMNVRMGRERGKRMRELDLIKQRLKLNIREYTKAARIGFNLCTLRACKKDNLIGKFRLKNKL